MDKKQAKGHLAAFVTCAVWGTTFISTKVLLLDFSPIEILFLRFVLGLAGLWLLRPARFRVKEKKQEVMFALAGLTGVCLFYVTEYVALLYTSASNVSVLVSLSPFATALLSQVFWKEEKLQPRFFLGCGTALIGVCLLCFSGEDGMRMNLAGDLLALISALCWAVYAVLSKKISSYGYDEIQVTKRTFIYGILFLIPSLFFTDISGDMSRFLSPAAAGNLIYLGLGASALCFVLWNRAVQGLGPTKTSVYIYLMPVVTIAASALFLQEALTAATLVGTGLILTGLFLSEGKRK